MREILFRGKRLDGGGWIEGDLRHGGYYLNDPDVYILQRFANTVMRYPVDPDTVGQHIGLTDKHGKRIFEGDILDYNGDKRPFRVVVRYLEGAFVCAYFDEDEGISNHFGSWNVPLVWWEIIGNAYDNPELLNKEERP